MATFSDEAQPDWSDLDAVVEHIVDAERPYAGRGAFDEAWLRTLLHRVAARTPDMAAAMTNHFLLEDGDVAGFRLDVLAGVPTLVLHGERDPLFPPAHGRALAAGIPGAGYEEMTGVGHQLPPARLWPWLATRIAEHVAG